MATYEEVIQGNINSLKELKDLIKSFKDELASAKEGSQEWENAVEGLSVAQGRLDQINRAAKGTLEGYNNSAKDSINTLKTRIKQLNTERNAMDMNSQEYADATAQLKALNDRLRDSGVAAGDMKANVGNYAASLAAGFAGVKDAVGQASSQMISAIGGLGQSLGGLSPTLGTVTTGFQGLSAAAGPVGIAIAAIAAALAAFREGITSSESSTNKFKEALAPLQAVLVLIQRAIQEVTSKVLDWMISLRENEKVINGVKTAITAIVTVFKTLQDIITGLVTVFQKFWDKLKDFGQKAAKTFEPVTKAVGKVAKAIGSKLKPVIDKIAEDTGLKENFEEAQEAAENFVGTAKEVSKEIDDINENDIRMQKARRALIVENAKLEGEIAAKERDIAEGRNKEVKDYDKILNDINEKTQLQQQIAKNNIALKKQELDAIRKRNALADSNTKDLQAEADAEAALIQATNALTAAEAAAAREKKEILSEKRSKEQTKATNALTAALKDLETQYTNTLSTIEKPIAPEGAEIDADSINAYHDAMIANYQAEYEAYSAMTEQKIAALQAFIEEQKAAGLDTTAQEAEISKLRAQNVKEYKKMIASQKKEDDNREKQLKANYNAQLSAFSNLMGSMEGLFAENTVAYKASATAKALIDTYLAANEVFAQQQGGLPTRIAAMAATIAQGLANVMAIWKTDTKNPSVSNTTVAAATAAPQVDNTPYTYARTVQTVASEEILNQSSEPMKVYVLESDITNAQNKSKVRVMESEW